MSLPSATHRELDVGVPSSGHAPLNRLWSFLRTVSSAAPVRASRPAEGPRVTAQTQEDSQEIPAEQTEDVSAESVGRVFDAAPLNSLGRSRRLAITSLMLGCNIMQMICNFVGVSGGLEISHKFGVGDGQANWAAAAYPLVAFISMPPVFFSKPPPDSLVQLADMKLRVDLRRARSCSSAVASAPCTGIRTCCCLATPS
jgi:hypothetical protein